LKVLGIDFGACSMKLALCEQGRILQTVAEPMPENLVRSGRILSPEAMSPVLAAAMDKHHISGHACAVILPASLAFCRRVTVPMMTPEQLALNLPFDFRDYITAEKDKYHYDYAVLDIVKNEMGEPEQLDLLAAATLKSTISDYEDMLRRARLKLTTAATEEFAYANLIRRYETGGSAETEYCFIDLGHSATRIYIYTGNRFEVLRILDVGGADIDKAVAETVNVDTMIARSYKESNLNGALELEACKQVYQRIGTEIMRAVNFYRYNNRGSSLSACYLCGGGTQNPVLVQVLRENLNLELRDVAALLRSSQGGLALFPAAFGMTEQ